ncbi:DUF885 domain-containing protein [Sinimarinibacterium sp. CAU 1509]|uniref:DUF885 domain-containing protein n=1 Tax=Sinimarinibacterium sp. CAU 1509 TaxID=2562283 RepID=UPI0010AD7EFB|nr:DUF885 domain-containing protein [Sinimarinibacterium sp. CAU 1509]TJY63038.1 DUF885 domain-containing protein [Sinimarinibacterium sp. CAU 1509]
MRRWIIAGLASICAFCSLTARADATAELHALFDREWQRGLQEDPEGASYLGDARYNDRWPDRSLTAIAASHAADQAALKALDAIDRDALPAGEQINYDLFRRQYTEALEGYAFHPFLMPLNQRGGIQTQDEILEVLRFEKSKDYDDWLARLEALPTLIDQTEALMREGLREKRMQPQIVMQRVPAQIDKQIVDDPSSSPFFKPFIEFAENIAPEQQQAYRERAQRLIAKEIVPAYQRFRAFFVNDYLPACPQQVGAWVQPDGDKLYAFRTRQFTTTQLTPKQIHAIGLSEVKRIRAQMQAIIRQVGFDGDFAAFNAHLRSDPQFYYTDGDALLEAYRALAKRIDPELPRLFKTTPRLPYGVRPIPDNIAPDTTTAYYLPGAADGTRAGYYYVNLYKPESRPKYEMEALTLHESVPGHHFQIARAQELGALPEFRKNGWGMTAFVEGWGLYAESLGDELGLYQDPYSKYGALTYEMWRAVRLVVDTGMHYKHWTREQAIDYFKANTPKAELDIVNEIDRYIAWPGQALAYKIGQLKIRELRTRAEKALGQKFDVREFHDVVLGSGAIPLDLLERNVDAWIQAQRSMKS